MTITTLALDTTQSDTNWDDDDRSLRNLAYPSSDSVYVFVDYSKILKEIALTKPYDDFYDDDDDEDDDEDDEIDYTEFDKPTYCVHLSRTSSSSSLCCDTDEYEYNSDTEVDNDSNSSDHTNDYFEHFVLKDKFFYK
jgi:hypothetical protein